VDEKQRALFSAKKGLAASVDAQWFCVHVIFAARAMLATLKV
jgi:hypothetical protein